MTDLVDKLGRQLLLGTAAWAFTAAGVTVTPAPTPVAAPTGTIMTYNFAGTPPSLPTFITGAGNGSAVNGSGQYVLQPGSGMAAFGPAAVQGELVVTLAAPGKISFGFGLTGTGSGANGLILYDDYMYLQAANFTNGAYAGYQTDSHKGYPVGTVWRMVQNGAQFALFVDGALFFASSCPAIAAGGRFAVRLLDGATSPSTITSVAYNPVATLPTVVGLTVAFLPISTALLAGVKVFQASSTTTTGNHDFTLAGPDAGLFTIDVNTGAGVLAADHPPLGSRSFTLTDSDSGASATGTFSTTVVQGSTLDPSAMPVILATGLTNGTAIGAQVASFSQPAGMTGTISYSLKLRPPTIEGPGARYAVDAVGHKVTTVALLAASPEPVTLVATNGVDVCLVPFTVGAAAAAGSVFEVGPGRAYPYYANATSAVFEDAVGPATYGPGVQFHVHTRPGRRDWYSEFTASTQSGVTDRGHQMAYGGYAGPYGIVGVPDAGTGALPVVGGDAGYYGKGGVLLTGTRDVSLSNLEAENVVIGPNNVAGVRDDGARQGNTTISNYYGHNNHNAYLGSIKGRLTMSNILALMCGTGNSGFTHNWYMDAEEAAGANIVSQAVNGGHCWKDRSVTATYTDCVFSEGIVGRGSSAMDIPDGGGRRFLRVTFIKGPMANNVGLVQYAREQQPNTPGAPNYARPNPGAELYFENVTFVNLYPGSYGNGDAIAVWAQTNLGGVPVDPATGLPVKVTFVNCSQFGFKPNKFLCVGNSDNGGTSFPAGVATLSEPPPIDLRSPLIAGTPVRAPMCWWSPNPQSYTVNTCNCSNGVMDPGVHEIRCDPAAAVGTPLCQLTSWGIQAVASSDPAYNPWGTGAVYSALGDAGFIPANPYFGVTPGGVIQPIASRSGAPPVSFLHVKVVSADGLHTMDAVFPIINSATPSRTDNIPAGFSPRVLPLGQEALA